MRNENEKRMSYNIPTRLESSEYLVLFVGAFPIFLPLEIYLPEDHWTSDAKLNDLFEGGDTVLVTTLRREFRVHETGA